MKSDLIKTIVAICAIAAVIWGGYYLYNVNKYKKTINEIQLESVNLNNIQDGKYDGKFGADLIFAEVEVTVDDHKIKDIDLIRHKNERGQKAEAVIDEVIEKQTINVDTISGATNSSKVILKAIENALNNKAV